LFLSLHIVLFGFNYRIHGNKKKKCMWRLGQKRSC